MTVGNGGPAVQRGRVAGGIYLLVASSSGGSESTIFIVSTLTVTIRLGLLPHAPPGLARCLDGGLSSI